MDRWIDGQMDRWIDRLIDWEGRKVGRWKGRKVGGRRKESRKVGRQDRVQGFVSLEPLSASSDGEALVAGLGQLGALQSNATLYPSPKNRKHRTSPVRDDCFHHSRMVVHLL